MDTISNLLDPALTASPILRKDYLTTITFDSHARLRRWVVYYQVRLTNNRARFIEPARSPTLHLTRGAAHRAARRWTRPRTTPR